MRFGRLSAHSSLVELTRLNCWEIHAYIVPLIMYVATRYKNKRGWHALFHSDCQAGSTARGAAGGHGYSADGKAWAFNSMNAYSNIVKLTDGTEWTLSRRERWVARCPRQSPAPVPSASALYLALQSADLDLCCETTACIIIRPKLIIDERGNPTHLINGIARTGDDTCGDHPGDHTFTFVQPIAQ